MAADLKSGSRKFAWLAVLGLLLAVYLGSAFAPALQDDADSSHAEAAREMLVHHDWVTLHINGVRYLEKAPLMYWLVANSYRIFGANEFATRLPTVLSMFLITLLALRWATRAFGKRAGVYAGLFFATGAGCYLFTRILIPEAILALLIAAAFYSFLTALESRQAWRYYAGYALLALAVLTKGLLALVVIGISMPLYLLITGEWRRWREFRIGTGLLLFLLIAVPWHLLAGLRNPRFFWFYFVNEHFMRFLGKRIPKDYNKLPATLYWTLHLVWLFPWSLFLPVCIKRLIADFKAQRQKGIALDFRSRTQLICVLWASVTLLFFSLSTNQEYYTFPAYLPLFMLIASAVADEEREGKRKWLLASTGVGAAVRLAAAGVLIAGLWSSRHLPFVPDIGSVLAQTNLSNDTLSMGHMLDLTGQSFAALRLPAIMAVIAFVVGAIVEFVLRLRNKPKASVWAAALAMGLFLIAAHTALGRFDPYLSSRNLAQQIAGAAQPTDRVMIYGDQAFGSSLLFYLRRPISLVNGRTTSMWWGSTYPDAPKIFLDDQELVREWNSGERIFLFVPQHQQATVEKLLPTGRYIFAQSSGKIVYSNRL